MYLLTFRFLKLFTEIPIEKINEISKWEGSKLNEAKILLADEATKLLHGENCLLSIHSTVESLFINRSGGDLESLPKVIVPISRFDKGVNICELFVISGLVSSKAETRRLIKGAGAKLNDQKIESDTLIIMHSDFDSEGRIKLSSGKKNHVLIVKQ